MYAIVDIAGQQFKVKKDQKVFVHRLEGNEGTKVEFNKVLLIDNEGKMNLGTPVIDGARVAAKILAHERGDKVIIFKKKRRKGYQKSTGHRQDFTQILIQGILAKGENLKVEEEPIVEKKKAKAKKEVIQETAEDLSAATEEKPKVKKTTKKAVEVVEASEEKLLRKANNEK